MGEMDDKLRSMRVNQDQRKRLMAAGRFGLGPLVEMGMVEKKEYPETLPLAGLGAPRTLALDGPRQPLPREESRKQAFRNLHVDDGLEDLNAFLAPNVKRRPPASRDKAAVPLASSTSGSGKPKEGEDSGTARKLVTRLAPRPPPEPDVEPLSPQMVRTTASAAGARPKAATFKARQGPTIEEVKHVQALFHEQYPQDKMSSACLSQVLEAAIEELRMEEVRRARKEERKRREEWRKTWKEERKKKTAPAKAAKPEDDNEEASEGSGCGSSLDSRDSSERQRLKDSSSVAAKMNDEQRTFWGETVKGRVSNVNKGFTDADLEQRFKSQQAAAANENLMTESQVIALMKAKDRGKEKVKRKEKPKDAIDRSRERRRRSSSR